MKTKVTKSPVADEKKLTVCLKSAATKKSPLSLLKTTRKGNILTQMTSTTTKRTAARCPTNTNQYQDSMLTNTRIISLSDQDISGITPLVNTESRSSLLNLTPKITISSSRNSSARKKDSKKTVQRKMIKSPTINNNKVLKRTVTRPDDLESQLKKKNSEVLSLNRKINRLEETLSEKNKMIKDLEIRFPKMLSELSRGLGKDPEKLKVSLELKESMKRNRQLSGSQERNEKLIKIKDDKIKQIQKEKELALDELKLKEREHREVKGRLVALEQRFPQMVNKLEDKEMELRRIKDDNDELKYKLKVINEENFAKMIELEKMSSEIVDLNLNLEEKEANFEELHEKYEEVVNKLNIAVRNCDELTDRNRCRKSTLTQDNADTIEEVSERDEDVFEEEMQVDVGDSSTSATPGGINFTNCSNVSDSEYDVSAGTIAKVNTEELKIISHLGF